MVKYLILLLVLSLSSCAPMPGNTLFKEVKEPMKISEIKDFKENPQNLLKVVGSCYIVSMKANPIFTTVATGLGVPPIALGCADIRVNRDGVITKCHIYYPTGDERIRQHELRHCMGYKDVFF